VRRSYHSCIRFRAVNEERVMRNVEARKPY